MSMKMANILFRNVFERGNNEKPVFRTAVFMNNV